MPWIRPRRSGVGDARDQGAVAGLRRRAEELRERHRHVDRPDRADRPRTRRSTRSDAAWSSAHAAATRAGPYRSASAPPGNGPITLGATRASMYTRRPERRVRQPEQEHDERDRRQPVAV